MVILSKLQHKNIVQLYDSFESSNHVCFVMELCEGGDLLSYVRRRKKLDEITSAYFFKQICEAINFCHNQQIVHSDIKLDNLLLQEEGNVKLCDFGVSKQFDLPEQQFDDEVGTPAFMAPEIVKRQPYYGTQVDVWNLGIVLFIMLTGQLPFKSDDSAQRNQMIISGDYSIPEALKLSNSAIQLIRLCLNKDPASRPTIQTILQHKWLQEAQKINVTEIFTQQELKKMKQLQQTTLQSGDPMRLVTEMNLSDYEQKGEKLTDELRNMTSKSIIFAPFNSTLKSEEKNTQLYLIERMSRIHFKTKVKEANRQYEFNYNGQVDNGVQIALTKRSNSQKEVKFTTLLQPLDKLIEQKRPHRVKQVTQVSEISAPSQIIFNNNRVIFNEIMQKEMMTSESDLLQVKKQVNKFNKGQQEIDMLIVCKIENEFGYPENFIVDSLKHNIKNDATTCYYLFRKEDKDEIVNLL